VRDKLKGKGEKLGPTIGHRSRTVAAYQTTTSKKETPAEARMSETGSPKGEGHSGTAVRSGGRTRFGFSGFSQRKVRVKIQGHEVPVEAWGQKERGWR